VPARRYTQVSAGQRDSSRNDEQQRGLAVRAFGSQGAHGKPYQRNLILNEDVYNDELEPVGARKSAHPIRQDF